MDKTIIQNHVNDNSHFLDFNPDLIEVAKELKRETDLKLWETARKMSNSTSYDIDDEILKSFNEQIASMGLRVEKNTVRDDPKYYSVLAFRSSPHPQPCD